MGSGGRAEFDEGSWGEEEVEIDTTAALMENSLVWVFTVSVSLSF